MSDSEHSDLADLAALDENGAMVPIRNFFLYKIMSGTEPTGFTIV